MGQIDEYNIGAITEKALMDRLKESVIDRLISEMVADFKSKAEPIVRKEVEKVGIKGVETFRDMARMRDEIKIYCEWKG